MYKHKLFECNNYLHVTLTQHAPPMKHNIIKGLHVLSFRGHGGGHFGLCEHFEEAPRPLCRATETIARSVLYWYLLLFSMNIYLYFQQHLFFVFVVNGKTSANTVFWVFIFFQLKNPTEETTVGTVTGSSIQNYLMSLNPGLHRFMENYVQLTTEEAITSLK